MAANDIVPPPLRQGNTNSGIDDGRNRNPKTIIIMKTFIFDLLSCRDMDSKKLITVLLLCSLCVSVAYGQTMTKTVTAGGTTSNQTIVQIAQANPNFSTLVTALQAAGLVETLSGAGPYTVFAPTNAAFDALPPGTLNSLLANRTALISVLTYHVSPGNYLATDVASMSSLPTVQGQPLAVTVPPGGGVRVDGANIIQTDIRASNGVIHVIDAVMIPPTGTATPTATPIATLTATRTATPSPTRAGFDAVLVSVCALAGLALLIGVRRRF